MNDGSKHRWYTAIDHSPPQEGMIPHIALAFSFGATLERPGGKSHWDVMNVMLIEFIISVNKSNQ